VASVNTKLNSSARKFKFENPSFAQNIDPVINTPGVPRAKKYSVGIMDMNMTNNGNY
jgi:hypothetical protein